MGSRVTKCTVSVCLGKGNWVRIEIIVVAGITSIHLFLLRFSRLAGLSKYRNTCFKHHRDMLLDLLLNLLSVRLFLHCLKCKRTSENSFNLRWMIVKLSTLWNASVTVTLRIECCASWVANVTEAYRSVLKFTIIQRGSLLLTFW